MKIMTNQRGLYSIRKGVWPFYRYFDLEQPGFWWKKTNRFYPDCWASKEKAEEWFGILKPTAAVTILKTNDKQFSQFHREKEKNGWLVN